LQIERGKQQTVPKSQLKIANFDDAEIKAQIGKIISDK
jgi:hypothetical protein